MLYTVSESLWRTKKCDINQSYRTARAITCMRRIR